MAYNTQHIIELVRQSLLPLPGAREGMCFGDVAFYVQQKLLCTIKADGLTMYLYHHDRDELMAIDPQVYFTTPHYKNYPSVLINLQLIAEADLKPLVLNAWKLRANKTQLKAYEAMAGKP